MVIVAEGTDDVLVASQTVFSCNFSVAYLRSLQYFFGGHVATAGAAWVGVSSRS